MVSMELIGPVFCARLSTSGGGVVIHEISAVSWLRSGIAEPNLLISLSLFTSLDLGGGGVVWGNATALWCIALAVGRVE